MINWRDGKAGFVGAAKRLIKGVFQYSYTVTTEAIDLPECSEAVISIIQSRGQGVLSTITSDGVGVLSSIQATEGLLSIIQSRGQGVSSPVTSDGVGVESTFC